MTATKRQPAAKPPTAATNVPASRARPRPVAASQAVAPLEPAPAAKKEKRVRCSFTLPESQLALLGELKKRCLVFGVKVKKGELLAAGLRLLADLPETALEAAVLPSVRQPRPPATPKKRNK